MDYLAMPQRFSPSGLSVFHAALPTPRRGVTHQTAAGETPGSAFDARYVGVSADGGYHIWEGTARGAAVDGRVTIALERLVGRRRPRGAGRVWDVRVRVATAGTAGLSVIMMIGSLDPASGDLVLFGRMVRGPRPGTPLVVRAGLDGSRLTGRMLLVAAHEERRRPSGDDRRRRERRVTPRSSMDRRAAVRRVALAAAPASR